MSTRTGVITFKCNPMSLVGPALSVGDAAPDFSVTANDMSAVTLADLKGKVTLLSVVPSLDTPVCDLQSQRFNTEAKEIEGLEIYTLSLDLPFAQRRWCGAHEPISAATLSDYKDRSFTENYGLLIDELKLATRAVLVIDAEGVIKYIEIVPEVTDHPDYDAALAAAKGLL